MSQVEEKIVALYQDYQASRQEYLSSGDAPVHLTEQDPVVDLYHAFQISRDHHKQRVQHHVMQALSQHIAQSHSQKHAGILRRFTEGAWELFSTPWRVAGVLSLLLVVLVTAPMMWTTKTDVSHESLALIRHHANHMAKGMEEELHSTMGFSAGHNRQQAVFALGIMGIHVQILAETGQKMRMQSLLAEAGELMASFGSEAGHTQLQQQRKQLLQGEELRRVAEEFVMTVQSDEEIRQDRQLYESANKLELMLLSTYLPQQERSEDLTSLLTGLKVLLQQIDVQRDDPILRKLIAPLSKHDMLPAHEAGMRELRSQLEKIKAYLS